MLRGAAMTMSGGKKKKRTSYLFERVCAPRAKKEIAGPRQGVGRTTKKTQRARGDKRERKWKRNSLPFAAQKRKDQLYFHSVFREGLSGKNMVRGSLRRREEERERKKYARHAAQRLPQREAPTVVPSASSAQGKKKKEKPREANALPRRKGERRKTCPTPSAS